MHFVVSHTINPFASNHNTSTTTLFPLFPLPAEMSFVGPPNAEAKVEQFLVEWLSDDAVRNHWKHQVSLLLSGQWSPHNQPPSPIQKSSLLPTLPRSRTASPTRSATQPVQGHQRHSTSPSPSSSSYGERKGSPLSTGSGPLVEESSGSTVSAPAASNGDERRARLRERGRQLKRNSFSNTADADPGISHGLTVRNRDSFSSQLSLESEAAEVRRARRRGWSATF